MRSFEKFAATLRAAKSSAKNIFGSASHGTEHGHTIHGLYTPTLLPTPMMYIYLV